MRHEGRRTCLGVMLGAGGEARGGRRVAGGIGEQVVDGGAAGRGTAADCAAAQAKFGRNEQPRATRTGCGAVMSPVWVGMGNSTAWTAVRSMTAALSTQTGVPAGAMR